MWLSFYVDLLSKALLLLNIKIIPQLKTIIKYSVTAKHTYYQPSAHLSMGFSPFIWVVWPFKNNTLYGILVLLVFFGWTFRAVLLYNWHDLLCKSSHHCWYCKLLSFTGALYDLTTGALITSTNTIEVNAIETGKAKSLLMTYSFCVFKEKMSEFFHSQC